MSRGSDQTWTGKRTFRGGLEDPGAPLRNVRDGHRTDRRQCAVRGAGPRQTVKLVLAEQDIALDLRPERRVLDLGAGQLACVLRERHGRDREHGGRLDRVEVPLARERLAGREGLHAQHAVPVVADFACPDRDVGYARQNGHGPRLVCQRDRKSDVYARQVEREVDRRGWGAAGEALAQEEHRRSV